MRWTFLAMLAACEGGEDAPALMDTGWFPPVTVDTDGAACAERVSGTVPEDGATEWYWRTPLRVEVEAASDVYVARLSDALGRPVPVTLVPASEGGLMLDVVFEGGLAPSTTYVLEVTDCASTTTISFTTSELGRPVQGGVSALRDRTYELLLDDPGAVWIQPGGLGTILGSFFGTPILLGVQWVDAARLDWIGATGFVDEGETWQDTSYPTWSFPVSDFSEAPFFTTEAPEVQLVVSGYDLPIYDFRLEGTFAADGASFRGAVLRGMGDTRYSGGALGTPEDEDALCRVARGIGVQCEACPDGEELCLTVEVRNLTGREVPDTTLDVVAQ